MYAPFFRIRRELDLRRRPVSLYHNDCAPGPSLDGQGGLPKGETKMESLIAMIARELVDDKENVSVTADPAGENGVVVYHLHVAPDDMGRVIGKQGRIAKAIRTVVRSAAGRSGGKVMVEID